MQQMKNHILLLLTPLFLQATIAQSPKTLATKSGYTNPLPVQFGDPYVLQTNGMYYMYGTGGGAEKGFSAYSSKNLVNWKPEGQVYFPTIKMAGAIQKPHGAALTGHRKCMRRKENFTCFTVPNGNIIQRMKSKISVLAWQWRITARSFY